MEFFNKKEDVIDIKLTQFGRYLLGKGKLKPAYYAFFDDNVIYASEKMAISGSDSGLSELQNSSQERIKQTPTVKHQVSFTSLQKQFNSVQEYYDKNPEAEFQKNAEKNYLLPSPLGTMNVNTGYVPAWTVTTFNSNISGSSSSLVVTSSFGSYTLNIPQLSMSKTINTINLNANAPAQATDQNLFLTDLSEAESAVGVNADDDLFFLLKVDENNSFFQKKNFDIEIFEIEEEFDSSNIKIGESIRPLLFVPPGLNTLTALEEEQVQVQQQYSEYYFDILVDEEIDDNIICRFDGSRQKQGVFADSNKLDCNEVENRIPEIVYDIYTDEEDFPEEVC